MSSWRMTARETVDEALVLSCGESRPARIAIDVMMPDGDGAPFAQTIDDDTPLGR